MHLQVAAHFSGRLHLALHLAAHFSSQLHMQPAGKVNSNNLLEKRAARGLWQIHFLLLLIIKS